MNKRTQNSRSCGCGQYGNMPRTTEAQTLPCTAEAVTETEAAVQTCGCGSSDEVSSSEKFCVNHCCDFVRKNIGTIRLGGLGQVINASVTLCDLCPNRTVALGVTLAEVDDCGCETNLAFKSFDISTPCRGGNLKVNDITFVVPRNGNGRRCFRLYATANYLDTTVFF